MMSKTDLKKQICRLEKEKEGIQWDIWKLRKQIPVIEREISLAKLEMYKQNTEKNKRQYFVYGVSGYSKIPII